MLLISYTHYYYLISQSLPTKTMNNQNEINTLITRVSFTDNNQRLEITNQGITKCDDLADLST